MRRKLRNPCRSVWFVLLLVTATAASGQEFLDRLDEKLTFSAWNDQVRARLSGTLDLEYYHVSDPPFGIFDSTATDLFNPRLTLFLDVQFGPHVYAFVQSRVDRGFDPADGGPRMRLDEYAIRYTPWEDGRFSIQVGKFSSVVGRWNARHLSWDNPFITAPLPYHQPTTVSDLEVPESPREFAEHGADAAGYDYLPILWDATYSSGVSVSGKLGKFEYALELKNSALSSRPESWDLADTGFERPTVNARVGYRPDPRWNLGFSASRGPYLREGFEGPMPRGTSLSDYDQLVLGQDISFEWHHLQLWAEFYECRFEVPNVGHADTFAYFVEAKYRFSPEFHAALRWNQQVFDDVPDGRGGDRPWGNDLCQVDAALGYRFTPHTQVKLQYTLQMGTSGAEQQHMLGVQFTTRF